MLCKVIINTLAPFSKLNLSSVFRSNSDSGSKTPDDLFLNLVEIQTQNVLSLVERPSGPCSHTLLLTQGNNGRQGPLDRSIVYTYKEEILSIVKRLRT